MKRFSPGWHQAIMRSDNFRRVSHDPLRSNFPVLPWLTHWVDPKIAELIDHCGIEKELGAGEPIFSSNEKIASLVLLKSGVTARGLANPDAQSRRACALATPNRIAAGNLNFFSHRHAIGRYYTITPAKLVYCPRDLLLSVVRKDIDLFQLLVTQFELATLSDRLGFACMSLLDASDRLKVLNLIWAVNFGTFVTESGGQWIKMPVPMGRSVRAQVTGTSVFWVDQTLKKWRSAGLWRCEGDWAWIKTELIAGVYEWIKSAGEASSDYRYPDAVESLIYEKKN